MILSTTFTFMCKGGLFFINDLASIITCIRGNVSSISKSESIDIVLEIPESYTVISIILSNRLASYGFASSTNTLTIQNRSTGSSIAVSYYIFITNDKNIE